MTRPTPPSRIPAWVNGASLLLGTAALVWRFIVLHGSLAPAAAPTLAMLQAGAVHAPPDGFGWWSWWDQSWYIESALAWARLDLNPALHWYPPGYPLMGAAFARLTPADPFAVPDLLCLVAALWLFAAIAHHLLGRAVFARSVGAWLFVLVAGSARVLWAWVVPWTTTPETVCLFVCLLGTVRFMGRASRRDAFLAGFGAAATLAFRPADAAVVGGVCAVAGCCALLRQRPGWDAMRRVTVAALLGAAIPVVAFGAAYLVVNGPHLDGYLTVSAEYGFEWGLLPLRWVIIMVSPQPLFLNGEGMAQVFPWIVPGIAGMAAAALIRAVSPAMPRAVHWAVMAATMLDTLQFVCYRDLHPDFLWHNGIYHYFKWTLPVFGLYAAILLRALAAGPRIAAVLAAAAVIPGLFMWRVAVKDVAALAPPRDAYSLTLPHGLSDLRDVLFARTVPNQTALVPFGSTIRNDATLFRSTYDFKLTPWSETLMVQPLRRMPDAPGTLKLGPGSYHLDPAVAPVLGRAALAWGLPCWAWMQRAACRTSFPLPAPSLPLGQRVRFGLGQDGEPYRLTGLSPAESEGDWTDGPVAALWFRLPPRSGPATLEVTAHGFAPERQPTRITAYVNGVEVGRWRFGPLSSTAVSQVPAGAFRADGNAVLDMVVANPRSPSRYGPSPDLRELGIQLESLRIRNAPGS